MKARISKTCIVGLVALALFGFTSCGGAVGTDVNLEELIQKATSEFLKEYRGNGEEIEVTVATSDEQVWALACFSWESVTDLSKHVEIENYQGDEALYLWEITGFPEKPEPIYHNTYSSPGSPGIVIYIVEWESEYVVFGCVADYHWSANDDTIIELEDRNYAVIQSQTKNVRVPANKQGFICILDSPFRDITVFDKDYNVLLRFSDQPGDFAVEQVEL